jgi:heat-inducible transcriptional repressor
MNVEKDDSAPLDTRKQQILRIVVHDYVATVEPVASQQIVERHRLGVKSATIRHEMAEMTERGYLRQPYTSAGRVPSDVGYRFYVDRIMPGEPDTPPGPRAKLPRGDDAEIGAIIQDTCRILSGVTTFTSVAAHEETAPPEIRHIHLAPVSANRLALLLVLSTGQVEHRVIQIDEQVAPAALQQLSNYLTIELSGSALDRMRTARGEDLPPELAGERELCLGIMKMLRQIAREVTETRVFIEGTAGMIRHPEFTDPARFEVLLHVLDRPGELVRALDIASEDGAGVTIGEEHGLEAMKDMSVVSARYTFGTRGGGRIGVVGPTRMDYKHTTSAVRWIARKLSDLLARIAGDG